MTTRVTPEQTARHLQRLAERRALRAAARGERLRASLPEAARLLREGYGAERVVLFGSLATGRLREQSDVDLAVWGLPVQDYFAALADLMGLFEAPVDLVRIEDAPESLRERVEAEGVIL
jgi:uncharacterized protein